ATIESGATLNINNAVLLKNKFTSAQLNAALICHNDRGNVNVNGMVLKDNEFYTTASGTLAKQMFATRAPSDTTGKCVLNNVYCDDTEVTRDLQDVSGLTAKIGDSYMASGEAAAAANVAGEDSIFFYTTEDGVELGTEANATRRVSYQVDGREVAHAYANGGDQITLSYTAPYATTLSAGVGDLDGNVLTLPTEGYMIVPVAVTPTESAMQTVYGYQGVKEISSEVTSGDYTIANAEEWMYVYNNKANFNNLDVTLHLVGDIDLSESVANSFGGFIDTQFSVDGHDHTIKNWGTSNAPKSANGLFRGAIANYGGTGGKMMKSLKNFNVENVYLNGTQRGSAIVCGFSANNAGFAVPSTFLMQNVHVKDCSLTTTTADDHAILLARYSCDGASPVATITECSIIDTTMNANGDHSGAIFGKAPNSASNCTVYIHGNYLRNVTVNNKTSAAGLLMGTVEYGKAHIYNNAVIDSTINAASGAEANLAVCSKSGEMRLKYNLFAGNTVNSDTGTYLVGTTGTAATATNCNHTNIIDDSKLGNNYATGNTYGCVKGATGSHVTVYTAEEMANGVAAYTNNTYNSDADNNALMANRTVYWTNDAEGWIIPADGNQTRKVTFTVVDEEGTPSTSQVYTYYTDYTKKLIPAFDEHLYENYTWTDGTGEKYTLDKEFTSDVAYTAVGLVLDELQAALNYFTRKDLEKYFVDGSEINGIISDVNGKISTNEYQDKENAVPGVGAAALAKDIAVLKARQGTYQTPNGDYSNVPTVAMVDLYADSPNYTINSVEELLIAKTNEAKYPKGSTLNLMKDLDLEETNTFPGFVRPRFDFDGHNHTISNWTYDGGTTYGIAFISRGENNNIKNLTFDGVNLTGGRHSAVVFGSHNNDKSDYGYKTDSATYITGVLTIENVHVKNAVVNTADEQVAIFLANTQSGRSGHVINNCSIENSTINSGGAANVSGFVARLSGGVNVTITNCYMKGFSIPNGGANTSLFVGQPSSSFAYNIQNVAAYDCTIKGTGDIYLFGARNMVDGSAHSGSNVTLKNIILYNIDATTTTADKNVYISSGNLDWYVLKSTGVGNEINIYMNETTREHLHADYPLYHKHDSETPDQNVKAPTVLPDAEFTNGAAAWKANKVLAADYWLVDSDFTSADYPTMFAADGLGAPRQITLTENRTETANTTTHYTNGAGEMPVDGQTIMGNNYWYADGDATPYTQSMSFDADKALTLEEIVSVSVAWEAIEFVYNYGEWDEDNLKWNSYWSLKNENSNLISLTNNGTIFVTATIGYTAIDNGIAGSFTDGEGNAADTSAIPMNADGGAANHNYQFNISGEPEGEKTGKPTIGTLKVTLATP
ncbi:MAG: hypothetical protein IJN80_07785, partial [Clostridia bacterium]|nr:hypothetical protein [Clostridia bacterium]